MTEYAKLSNQPKNYESLDPSLVGNEIEDWNSKKISNEILGEKKGIIPKNWTQECARRLYKMKGELRARWFGLELKWEGCEEIDHLIDWILAAIIARENALLLGVPGVAKSEISACICQLLGLDLPRPDMDKDLLEKTWQYAPSPWQWWLEREERAKEKQKYFSFLMSRFTQPDELFGPIEISLLERGILARINFGLLTGPGVRLAFLDEIFKANAAVLNTLLGLMNERHYFNFGGMVKSDLIGLLAASNELPGGFATGTVGIGSGESDFQTLYAFLDRFPIRLLVPKASGTNREREVEPMESNLGKAFAIAIEREGTLFAEGERFAPMNPKQMPGINDILLLGRSCYQYESDKYREGCLFETHTLDEFKRAFIETAVHLQQHETKPEMGTITWSISPRKLKALFKIALAHALVRDSQFVDKANVELDAADLHVFDFIWDSPPACRKLEGDVANCIRKYWNKG
jgi:MoxR-like ATPase